MCCNGLKPRKPPDRCLPKASIGALRHHALGVGDAEDLGQPGDRCQLQLAAFLKNTKLVQPTNAPFVQLRLQPCAVPFGLGSKKDELARRAGEQAFFGVQKLRSAPA